jgi:hypothetical protein
MWSNFNQNACSCLGVFHFFTSHRNPSKPKRGDD